jgi:hypothetical protein
MHACMEFVLTCLQMTWVHTALRGAKGAWHVLAVSSVLWC